MEEGEIESQISFDEAQKFLKGKDAIMEYNVNEMLEAYLNKGGNTEDAIEMLANGYAATAQVANVMCDWLKALGDEPKPAGARRKRKDRNKTKSADATKGENSELSLEIYNGKEEAVRCVENALAAMIKKYFNADMADRIFEDGGIGIDWLPNLITHRCWRNILYSLMEEHRDCLMLTFTVKLISDAGFQNEISNVNTAAQQLDIYSRVFLTNINELLKHVKKGVDSAAYNQAFEEVARVVCLSEHTYTYAVSILKELSRTEKGWIKASCEAISDQLRKYIPEKMYDTTSLRIAIACTAQDQISTQVYQAILAMITKGELNPADVSIVFDAYILPRPPPIEIIRDSVFENMLIDALFHCDGPRVASEHRDKYVYLLAYAASVSETVSKNGARTQLRFELDPCRSAIEKAASTLESSDDILCELKDLMHYSKTAVVAAGILYYVQTLLLSESRLGDPPPVALVLLDHIVSLHSNLQPQAFDVCCQLYDRISEESEAAEVIMERQRIVVDRFVHLLSVGFAVPVLEKIAAMFSDGSIDASLVRYFAIEVLEIITPPYSNDFVSLLRPLVSDESIFDIATSDQKFCTLYRCPESMQCMRESDGSHVCRYMDCTEMVCGPKEECMPSFVGFSYCKSIVTCEGVKCKPNEKCIVEPMQNCADDCPMEANCVPK